MNKDKIRVVIVHGWNSSPEDCWIPWLSERLSEQGFTVYVPRMPNSKKPDIDEWIETLKNTIGLPDENTYFVGHSLGCYTIFRYLETLFEGVHIGGIVCIGGKYEHTKLPHKIDIDRVRAISPRIVGFFSDNDYHIPISWAERFKDELGADIHIMHNMGHFSRLEGITKIQEVYDSILDIIGKGSDLG